MNLITSTLKNIKSVEIASQGYILDLFGNPLKSSNYPTKEDKYQPKSPFKQIIQDALISPETITSIPDEVIQNQAHMDMLMKLAPSLYWKNWFPSDHKDNYRYFEEARKEPFTDEDFSKVPDSIRLSTSGLTAFMYEDYQRAILFYAPRSEYKFDLYTFGHKYPVRRKITLEGHLRQSWCWNFKPDFYNIFTQNLIRDIQDHRSKWNFLVETRVDNMCLSVLFNKLELKQLYDVQSSIEKYPNTQNPDAISLILNKVLKKKIRSRLLTKMWSGIKKANTAMNKALNE